MSRRLGWLLALTAACGPGDTWPPRHLASVRQPGAFREPPLAESSGAARSVSNPGLFWSINDSGNPATLFLADTTGSVRGFVRVAVTNTDWEAVTVGPCDQRTCVYIGDIGDNREVRASATIFRLPEPSREAIDVRAVVYPESLTVRYPNGPQDAEALIVSPDGSMGIISKGRNHRPRIYRIAPTAWSTPAVTAESIGELPLSMSLLLGRLVTDAALTPSGDTMAVRTYKHLYLFGRRRGEPFPTDPIGVCPIGGVDPQGEGVTWWGPNTWLMTSEVTRHAPGFITLLECRDSARSGG